MNMYEHVISCVISINLLQRSTCQVSCILVDEARSHTSAIHRSPARCAGQAQFLSPRVIERLRNVSTMQGAAIGSDPMTLAEQTTNFSGNGTY